MIEVTQSARDAAAFGKTFRDQQESSFGCGGFIECTFPMDGNCECFNEAYSQAIAAAEQRGMIAASAWQPIETAPRDQMFIWAMPKLDGQWGLGLAYRNVSGGWSDAYGAATKGATHWTPLPGPPALATMPMTAGGSDA